MSTSSAAISSARPAVAHPGHAVRVLYSFPHRIGAQRICATAWQQAAGLARAGARVTVLAGSVARRLPAGVATRALLAIGPWRIPYRVFGTDRLCRLHDRLVARWIERHAAEIDLIHAWPLAAERTIDAARRHGIPVVLERPNAHTRHAYAAVAAESRRLGLVLPPGSEHVFDAARLAREEREYAHADFLLCPSEFVARTFREEGFPAEKILRHRYGYDAEAFHAHGRDDLGPDKGLVVLFAGIGTPRKGLHQALEAWLASGANRRGTFLVCGTLLPVYRERIVALLGQPSVRVLGQTANLGAVMRESDVFVLPTVEEGSALVTYEARACGCVLAVSDASGAVCEHGVDALVHRPGDVNTLTTHLALLDRDRSLLRRLRARSLATVGELTWDAAGRRLLEVYREAFTRIAARRA